MLKPPRSGNCTVDKNPTLISFTELKEISKKGKSDYKKRMKKLQDRLDEIIKIQDWEIHGILLDHDYSCPDVVDCIIYYTTGFFTLYILLSVKIFKNFEIIS